jgi:hypothetical protein
VVGLTDTIYNQHVDRLIIMLRHVNCFHTSCRLKNIVTLQQKQEANNLKVRRLIVHNKNCLLMAVE